jgi:hypothetical protein
MILKMFYKRREQGTGRIREQGIDKKHSFAPV